MRPVGEFTKGSDKDSWLIAIVTMVRNEVDLIRDFLGHHLELANTVIVADHLSSDGTFAAMKSLASRDSRLTVLTYDFEQYFQAAVVTALVRYAADRGADWIIPLDADEFLPFSNSVDLLTALNRHQEPIVRFAWRNLAPQVLPRNSGQVDWSTPFLTLRVPSRIGKIAVSGAFVRANIGLSVEQGAHSLALDGQRLPANADAGPIFHLPIRSLSQARGKFENGTRALEAVYRRNAKYSSHWFALRDSLNEGLSPDDARALALHYPDTRLVETADEVVSVPFSPNGTLEPSAPAIPDAQRLARSSRLSGHELRVVIVGERIEIRPRPFWRLGRVGDRLRELRRASATRLTRFLRRS